MFWAAHYKAIVIVGGGALLLTLLIWLIGHLTKRSRARTAAAALSDAPAMGGNSPVLPLETQPTSYMTQPTEPAVYGGMSTGFEASHSAGGVAPPTYEEIYGREREMGAGISSGGENVTGHGSSPHEKS